MATKICLDNNLEGISTLPLVPKSCLRTAERPNKVLAKKPHLLQDLKYVHLKNLFLLHDLRTIHLMTTN